MRHERFRAGTETLYGFFPAPVRPPRAAKCTAGSRAYILRAFVDAPDEEQYGFGLMRSTGVKSGSLYPILERFERLRWIEGHDEAIDERKEGRPRRRLYRLTALGEREARKAVAAFYRDVGRAPAWVPQTRPTVIVSTMQK